MELWELPHSADCLVCGRTNPRGLHLSFKVEPKSGRVEMEFPADKTMCGFADIVHGGLVATVFDEAMVWAASWAHRRFCVCGELSVRFVRPALAGKSFLISAAIESARPRLLRTSATMRDAHGETIATATAKYVPLPPDSNRAIIATLLPEPATRAALEQFKKESHAR